MTTAEILFLKLDDGHHLISVDILGGRRAMSFGITKDEFDKAAREFELIETSPRCYNAFATKREDPKSK